MSKHEPFKPPFVNRFKRPTECQSCGSDELVLIHTIRRQDEVLWAEDFQITGDTTIETALDAWRMEAPGIAAVENTIQCRKCKAAFGLEGWTVLVATDGKRVGTAYLRLHWPLIKSLDI